ncbi:hypothetical protein ABBQ38_014769 [Trebouxia sp. C0009 RCD-2024]
MNGAAAGADARVAAFCSPGPLIKCSASTSGRPFGSPPSPDRLCSGPQRNDNGVLCWPVSAKPSQRLPRLQAVRGSRQEKAKKPSETPQTRQGEQNIVAQSAGYMTGLVNDLLYGAASRMERGQTTCIKCKGSGTLPCSECKGQGVVQPDKLKKATDPVRQAANRVSSMLGGSSSSNYNSHMLRSNRCQKCHGAGTCTCSVCQGHGFRGDDYE